ncbi:hypothetical protein D3C79_895900 [compost metagenome]
MPGCLGRQHQYLDTGIIGGQPGDDLQAIKLGDADIQNDDVRAMLPRQLQRVHAVIRLRNDFITMPLHQHAYSQANDRMIIHDQDFIHEQNPIVRCSIILSSHNSLVVRHIVLRR